MPAQVASMPPETYFNRLNALLPTNPPEPDDPELMARLAVLGIGPGAPFSMIAFDDDVRSAIDEGVADARQAVHDEEPRLGERVNGWNLSRDLGRYGTKYAYRAAWTWFGVGGNLIEDAFYPLSLVDGDGAPYDSANQYSLHFTAEQLPPVDAFWSITMYDTDFYLVDNPIDRYALGDRSNLTFADDGSLTIYLQNRVPRRGCSIQLAANTDRRRLQARPAALRPTTRSHRRIMDAATGRPGRLTTLGSLAARTECLAPRSF